MAAPTSMLHVRVDDEMKAQATLALAAMGMSVSDAVRLFLRRVVVDQAFPLELKVPNAETRAAMAEAEAEAEEIVRTRRHRLPVLTNCLPILKRTAASKLAALPRAAD